MTFRRPGTTPTHLLSISVACVDGVTKLSLIGELDAHTTSQLNAVRLPLTCSRRAVFDLSGLDSVDASGLRALLRLEAAVTGAGGTVEIADADGIVNHVLNVASGFEADADPANTLGELPSRAGEETHGGETLGG